MFWPQAWSNFDKGATATSRLKLCRAIFYFKNDNERFSKIYSFHVFSVARESHKWWVFAFKRVIIYLFWLSIFICILIMSLGIGLLISVWMARYFCCLNSILLKVQQKSLWFCCLGLWYVRCHPKNGWW